mmetsp:Transcript_50072/g.119122  ORF Transcript_50072/g.119122 Transcript_50072/m.119122 type:complete len:212 (+) Transcript_50072:1244-1879(+)
MNICASLPATRSMSRYRESDTVHTKHVRHETQCKNSAQEAAHAPIFQAKWLIRKSELSRSICTMRARREILKQRRILEIRAPRTAEVSPFWPSEPHASGGSVEMTSIRNQNLRYSTATGRQCMITLWSFLSMNPVRKLRMMSIEKTMMTQMSATSRNVIVPFSFGGLKAREMGSAMSAKMVTRNIQASHPIRGIELGCSGTDPSAQPKLSA